MPTVSIVFGLLLCGLSVFSMMGSLEKVPMSFIPMMFGIPLFIAGIISLNPHRRRIWTALAVGYAFLGLAASVGFALMDVSLIAQGKSVNMFAMWITISMGVMIGGFLVSSMVWWYRKRPGRINNAVGGTRKSVN